MGHYSLSSKVFTKGYCGNYQTIRWSGFRGHCGVTVRVTDGVTVNSHYTGHCTGHCRETVGTTLGVTIGRL